MARAVVRKCVRCVHAKPSFECPLMAHLPKHRVQYSRPFAVTGVDFAGPFIVRSSVRRVVGKKAWLSVFLCLSTRTVHLDVVEDMTSSAFLACLRRFMARRGHFSVIYSDNGTNFMGAQRELNAFIVKGGPEMAHISQKAPESLRRWKHVQHMLQTFWRRWHAEYLPQCQIKGKWLTRKRQLEMDDVVIVKDECTPPTKWKLGRVINLHPGSDGYVRVATVRLASGAEMRRPVAKLCVLPSKTDQDTVEL
ncbi:Ribonuclease H-like domain [Cinara cedri]|uniref:Ribonuclease H-like domain n=1 Tax=Cinara cedri TaxID=506608 RepID=A0A5E4MIB9_9HEMI|nr:Ribonuclease H-like domain [Cinara cedri]